MFLIIYIKFVPPYLKSMQMNYDLHVYINQDITFNKNSSVKTTEIERKQWFNRSPLSPVVRGLSSIGWIPPNNDDDDDDDIYLEYYSGNYSV
jgi:hypothetical protein